jgi:hypothetical protein
MAWAEDEVRVRAASVMLAQIPAGTAQYDALASALEWSIRQGSAQIRPLYPSMETAENVGRAQTAEQDSGYGEDDGEGGGEDDGGDDVGEFRVDHRPFRQHYETLEHVEWLADAYPPASVSACFPTALLGHVDLYVAELHQSETDGNRSSARQMADLLADGIVDSDDTMRRIRRRGVFRDWDGVDRNLDGSSAAYGGERRENISYGLDFLADTLPWIHDFSGPYVAATLPPTVYVLAHAWQFVVRGGWGRADNDLIAWGYSGFSGLERAADCLAAHWSANFTPYWTCPAAARAHMAAVYEGS